MCEILLLIAKLPSKKISKLCNKNRNNNDIYHMRKVFMILLENITFPVLLQLLQNLAKCKKYKNFYLHQSIYWNLIIRNILIQKQI